MNLKTELVALAIRHLTSKNIIAPSNGIDEFVSVLFTGKSADVRLAEEIVASAGQMAQIVKRANTNRKFKKITGRS